MEMYSYQLRAVEKMKNGCILCGDVGTGKSRTALLYFQQNVCCGNAVINGEGEWGEPTSPLDLYIITTAKKRDSGEWLVEAALFGFSEDRNRSVGGIKVTVDSWNNVKKYEDVTGAFFIFDEQRVSGYGAWTKTFLRITKSNQWILLSATPGDKWHDYIPVFIANGFFKTKGDFERRHCVFSPWTNFPKVERYLDEETLRRYRSSILVCMYARKSTRPHHNYISCNYDIDVYRYLVRWKVNPYTGEMIDNNGEYCYLLRKVVNSDPSRIETTISLLKSAGTAIIFYNFDYELELLKEGLSSVVAVVAEWNGHTHEPVPTTDTWAYLVQYNAGAEGWNCITTNTMIFFSQNYSYRMTKQAAGRIDRVNTPYQELYYYHLYSTAPIDIAISRALKNKKNFNEKAFTG